MSEFGEPWKISAHKTKGECYIVNADDQWVGLVHNPKSTLDLGALVRRIIAALNAVEGVPTEILMSVYPGSANLIHENVRLPDAIRGERERCARLMVDVRTEPVDKNKPSVN
jgi:hypothetical protein